MSRPSQRTLEAVVRHQLTEVTDGGYVAEEAAQESIAQLRSDVGDLLGEDAEAIALVESGSAAMQRLLDVWPLPPNSRAGVAMTGWGPNMEALERNGVAVVPLKVDDLGLIDLDELDRLLRRDPLDLIVVEHVASHRGLVQPASEVVAMSHRHGVPVWVDAAQAVGLVPAQTSADATFATSRKWLNGPRGVGIVCISKPSRDNLCRPSLARDAHRPIVHALDSNEGHIAGRVGLAAAVQELRAVGITRTHERLALVGEQLRAELGDLAGWRVYQAHSPASSITTIEATQGQDVPKVFRRLREHDRIVTSLILPWRAPLELDRPGSRHAPMIRVSPNVDVSDDQVRRLRTALAAAQ